MKATEEQALQTKGAESRVDSQIAIKPVMCFRHPPVCQNYKSNTGCKYKCHFRYVEAEEKPNKKSKKGGAKGQVALLEENVYSTEKLKIGIRSRR